MLPWSQSSFAADLLQVYELARKNDAQLMIAEANYLAASQGVPLAESTNRPQLSLGGTGSVRETDESNSGRNSSSNAGFNVNLTQSLFNTENDGNISVAEANTAAELAVLKGARQGLLLRAARAYFAILAATDNVEFTYAERNAIARQLEEAQKRFEVGLIAITDVYEAQASFDNSEAQVILAENILENGFQSLVVLTADSSINELKPLGEDLKLSLPNPATVESWVLLALENNFDLLAAQQNLTAARYERDTSNRNRYPTIDLFARYEHNEDQDDLRDDSDRDDVIVGIEVDIPLYAGGRIPSERAEAESRYVAAQNTLLLQNRLTVQQTRTTFLDVVSGISQVQALKQAFESSKIALEATQAGFEVGTRTSVDVLISLRETYRTQRDYAGSRYNYVLNKLRLKQAAGILSEEDLVEVNKTLTDL
jgi:outer membrane protein